MGEEKIIDLLIVRFLSGIATDEEVFELHNWLTQSRQNRLYYFSTKKIWLDSGGKSIEKEDIDSSWDRIRLRTTLQSKKEIHHKTGLSFLKFSIAASIAVLIGITSILGIQLIKIAEHSETIHEITVPMGARTNITLPEGSSVWLNAGSTLSYSSDFGRRSRKVTLAGEAYFEVVSDNNSVFTVNTRDLEIKVLGTRFNVKSYPDEEITETILISGKVEVHVTDEGIDSPPVILSPNQRITYSRHEGRMMVRENEAKPAEDIIVQEHNEILKPSLTVSNIVSAEVYTSWKDGKLTFRSESLKDLATKLERFYNVKITFDDDSIKELKYTGTLEEVTIEEVLRAIASSSNIKFKIDKNQIILTK